MEKKNEKKLSGWERKRIQDISDREKEAKKYARLDTYFSFGTPTPTTSKSSQPVMEFSEQTLMLTGHETQSINLTSTEMGVMEDLEVIEFSEEQALPLISDISKDCHLQEKLTCQWKVIFVQELT